MMAPMTEMKETPADPAAAGPAEQRRPRNRSRREWDRARRLWEDGYSDAEIGEKIGVTRQAVGLRRRRERWALSGAGPGAGAGGESRTSGASLRRPPALLDESTREAAREGDSAGAAAAAEKLARLDKLIHEAGTRAAERGEAPDDPRSDEELKAELSERLNRMYRVWIAEALRVMLRIEFNRARSQADLAKALQARIDNLQDGGEDECCGWPARPGPLAGGGGGFEPDPSRGGEVFMVHQGRDDRRLLFGEFKGKPYPPPWEGE